MKVRPLSQRDWDQLLVIASGYLTLTGGNLDQAMARAIEAHARLIDSVRKGRIRAQLAKGTVQLFVPSDGGLALAFESLSETPGPAAERPAPSEPPAVVASAVEVLPPQEPTPHLVRTVPVDETPPPFPDLSVEVVERPSSYTSDNTRDDASPWDVDHAPPVPPKPQRTRSSRGS